MGKVSNPYSLEIKQNYNSYTEINKKSYNYDGIYGPIPDENGFVDLSYYARNYISDYSKITEIPKENLAYLRSGLQANDMNNMFYCCYELTTIPNLNIDTSNVTNMSKFFYACRMLSTLNISNFDTSKVTNMYQMFRNCYSLTNITGNLDLSNCTNVFEMFIGTNKSLQIHLKNVPRSLNFSSSNGTEGQHYIIDNYID